MLEVAPKEAYNVGDEILENEITKYEKRNETNCPIKIKCLPGCRAFYLSGRSHSHGRDDGSVAPAELGLAATGRFRPPPRVHRLHHHHSALTGITPCYVFSVTF